MVDVLNASLCLHATPRRSGTAAGFKHCPLTDPLRPCHFHRFLALRKRLDKLTGRRTSSNVTIEGLGYPTLVDELMSASDINLG
jgi:hypothetical protein